MLLIRVLKQVAVLGITVLLVAGCTDRGSGPFGAGPDDRSDRGGGPDTLAVEASEDTYFERTIADGSYLLFGRFSSEGFESHSFIKFGNLPASAEGLEGASLLLYVVADRPPYNFTISRLNRPAPSEYPFWPFPDDGEAKVEVRNAFTTTDPKASVDIAIVLKVEIPSGWVSDWIDDPSSNHGLRLFGENLDASGNDEVERRFWSAGYQDEGFVFGPRIELAKSGGDTTRHISTSDFYIFKPSLDPVGGQSFTRVGGVYGYETLLRFPLTGFAFDSGVNKALLVLTVDRSLPELNDGVFDVRVRPVVGEWREDSTNVNVELEPASTAPIEIEAIAGGESRVEVDVTALVDVYAQGDFFDLGVQVTGLFSHDDKAAFVSSEAAVLENAPFLRVLYTTPPGRRY